MALGSCELMPPLLLRGGDVILPGGIEAAADLRVEDGVIAQIGRRLSSAGAEVFEASGLWIGPGLIDVHVHGAAGAMVEQGDVGAIERISAMLARFGVTGFLPTIATLPEARLRAAVEAVAAAAGRERGARILGIHLEGPYLSPLRAGAQPAQWMRRPSLEEFRSLRERSGGRIRIVTLAPELEGALPFIAAVRASGAVVSIGHSNATAAQTLGAVEAGARHVTHLFNAMPPFHHRAAGVAGVALTDDRVSVELICDGHHLAPSAVALALRCKPEGKVVLVSDAVSALGMREGAGEVLGLECTIAGGAVRLRRDGRLVGSCLGLDGALRNLRQWQPALSLPRLFAAASAAPAALIGERSCGRIAEGCRADLVVVDRYLSVAATICQGVPVWRRELRDVL